MRKGWKKKELGEIASVTYGFTGKAFIEGAFRYVRITDIDKNGELILQQKKYLEYSEEAKKFTLENNDLLMARTGATFAKVLLYRGLEPSVFASYLIKIDFKEKIINKLYWYFSKSENYWEQANKLSTGSAQPHFNGKAVKNVVFTFPTSHSEQKQIVAILDKAFTAIDQAKANIDKNIVNAKELFQSKLNNIFSQKDDGWEERNLGGVCENLDNKRIPITKSKRIEGDIPYYGASGIVDYVADYIFNEDLLLVSEDGANLLARTYPIAFSISGKTWVNNHAHALKFDKMVSQKFIEFYLNSIKLDNFISGMAQPKLNQRMLNSIPVPFPPIEIQEKTLSIVEELSVQIKSIITQYEQKITNLEELKKSILQKAFAGELTQKEVVA